jgi:DNA repair protein RecO (recombination protein O)
MPAEKALGLVLRTTDWSESSRIATLWTRELGKVRVLAKGGRRLRSNFESALDLLTVCSIVLLRKTSGSLDLLTEARVVQRFPQLSQDLQALYAGYYLAELLAAGAEDYDPHPALFDEAVATLRDLGTQECLAGPRLARFQLVWLRELGYGPALEACAGCTTPITGQGLAFSGARGGVLCSSCLRQERDRQVLSPAGWQALRTLSEPGEAWRTLQDPACRAEVFRVLGYYVTWVLGRRPRMLAYLGS